MSRANHASRSATKTAQKHQKTVARVFYLKPEAPKVTPATANVCEFR